MDHFGDLYGNEAQKAYFSALIREGKCSHAYILEAPRGGGKKSFSIRMAAELASQEKQDGEKKCRRILEGTSPDVRILSRDENKKTIGVDAVRDFMATVYLAPSELDFKMYIFDEADKITPQAQNALLKIIEEPPQNVYILLLCENALSLLSTVRSRAQKISLQVFNDRELMAYAEQARIPDAIDAEKLSFAVRMAGGSIGNLREVLENGEETFSAFQMAKQVIDWQAMKGRDVSYYDFLRRISDFVTTREKMDALTGYLLLAYGDLMRAKAADHYQLEFFKEEDLQKYEMLFAANAVIASFDAVDSVRASMRLNTNVALSSAILAMFLWRAA